MSRQGRLSRAATWAGRLLLLGGLTVLLLELTCRFLVLSDVAAAWPPAKPLRVASRFGNGKADDLHYEMRFRWLPASRRVDHPQFDPEVGWTSPFFQPGSFAHFGEPQRGGRRPILLFGDSFAFGMDGFQPALRLEELLEHSPLGAEYALWNYASGGYGLDQTLLVLRRATARHAGLDPIVVVSLYVDDDIDRCILGFTSWPKPRLRWDSGRLVESSAPVERVSRYLSESSTLPSSVALLLLRRALAGPDLSPGTPAQEQAKRELGLAILRDIVSELRQREMPFLFLLFLGREAIMDPDVTGWREPLVVATLAELEAPWVGVRSAFREATTLLSVPMDELFLAPDEPNAGHYSRLGNRIVFEVLLEGLRTYLDIGAGGDLGRIRELRPDVHVSSAGADQAMIVADYPALRMRGLQPPYAILNPQSGRPAEAAWRVVGDGEGLYARAAVVAEPPGAEAAARLAVQVDDAPPQEFGLRTSQAPVELGLNLRGARRLRLRAELLSSTTPACRVVVERFQLLAAPDLEPVVPALR